ncbi:alpha/beta hydrolase, partial [Myxococcota bacterium]|nr:alpha/beta hydrolase [Myxococcota bacterium]
MVRRGEYLERAVVVPGAAAPIEGLFHRGSKAPPAVFAPPHPSAGSMEAPVVAELAWAVTRAGHATLRFNYPG